MKSNSDNPYLKQIEIVLPRLLSLFDQNQISNTFGIGDRMFWGWKTIDFANANYQGIMHGLALIVKHKIYPFKLDKKRIMKRIVNMINSIHKIIHKDSTIGIINGLWANNMGMGGIIPIECNFLPSNNFMDLKLTGLQGDVMKESMSVAKSLAWNLTNDNIKKEWLTYFETTKCQGLHIHCPEGSISKDGPSAGAAITTAIYSLLNKKKIKNTIAITGEINLNGDILPIGGLDTKINGGIKAGVITFLYPTSNHKDFIDWKKKNVHIKDITFIEISNIKDIFQHVFI